MNRSDDIQDVWYVASSWMNRNDDIQDVWYVASSWMNRNDDIHDCRMQEVERSRTPEPRMYGQFFVQDKN